MKSFTALEFALVFAVAAIDRAWAWGNVGHETIGSVSIRSFISSETTSFVQTSLGSTYNESLGVAATWADTVKYETAYEYSKPYHFIDAEDSPLSDSCSVELSRDCGDEGCIISAIQNYTERLMETSLSATQRQEALKFVTHFLGDISQPLHVENYEVGGNDIDATCDGKSTNLHAVWDTGMLVKSVDANYDNDVQTYAAELVTRIKTGEYKSLASGWVTCITDSALDGTSCPLVWAKEANAYDCSTVFDYTKGDDLCETSYYTTAIPIIDLQLAKSGYRLAKWLDTMAL
ncbi:nuclease Le1 [Stereum hirsutum FP-91666 SS1]|uniref:Nuclease Le1 n=1 Tax=Stereum hirsutum (strain FP-91666) TaxID=721885 RepID=R7S041_STEHR|nr:nuclease Le1 [Stereum hirsutum FP-91666 SS1]EIM79942.1 nuclease Le1 [Stereum hirsutum FP-91666 SS1]